jgi:putative transposase
VLRSADGLTRKEIADEPRHSAHTVGKWRRRFAEHRIEGLSDEYRAGRPRTITDEEVADVIK